MVARKRDQWTRAHEIERLSQLMYDIDRVTGAFMTQCLRVSNQVPPEFKDEWLRRTGLVEEFRDWALRDCKRFIDDCCKDSENVDHG